MSKMDEKLFSLVGIEAGEHHPFNCPNFRLGDDGLVCIKRIKKENPLAEISYLLCPEYVKRNGEEN